MTLPARELPLVASVSALPVRGGDRTVHDLFEPLGYDVAIDRDAYDAPPEWGPNPYVTLTLRRTCRLQELLSHLYVLVPALDGEKHYWVGEDEVEKLVRHGAAWVATHPYREQIASRYLRRQRGLTRLALARLTADEQPEVAEDDHRKERDEERLEARVSLWQHRVDAVVSTLVSVGARSVLDLGCGEGRLLQVLVKDRRFERIGGVDVSLRSLERARERLRLDDLDPDRRARIELFQGAATYRDRRFSGHDAICAVEVIEHLEPSRVDAFARVVFEHAAPRVVVLTTPNVEYNVRFEGLAPGAFRHRDHRFEWNRAELDAWAEAIARRFGYSVRLAPIGPQDPEVGAPTQMAVFTR